MSLYLQPLLDTHDELIVDLFAGGGGASSGIEQALGRMVDVAINHDAAAVSMHEANHPQTLHLVSDVFEVCPKRVCGDRRPALLWASPDCTYHSKARGAKPIRHKNRKRRALAWVVTRWAGQVKPRVIMLENVEEFADWGPLIGKPAELRPCPRRRGRTFRKWVKSLEALGYTVEWRELRACDYGAPTIRKRLFLIARCDGQPIVWPEPTHGPGRKPYRTAAECIDWSIPMCSIFATPEEAKAWGRANNRPTPKRPLAENSLRRTARGVMRFVINSAKPFLVTIAHGETSAKGSRWGSGVRDIDAPLGTITGKGGTAVAAPVLVPRYGERDGQAPRCRSVEEPSPVVVPSGNGAMLAAANLMSYHSEKPGEDARASVLDEPIPTLDCSNRHAVVASFLAQHNGGFAEGNSGDGHTLEDPLSTINAKGSNAGVVGVFLDQANGGDRAGRPVDEPLATILTESRGHHGLTAVHLQTSNNSRNPLYGADEPAHTIVADGAAHSVVATHIQRDFGTSTGQAVDTPLNTITGDGGGKAALIYSFLQTYYGTGLGQSPAEPLRTITTKDRASLVTVSIDGTTYVITDIAMRMLWPHELYACQGFRHGYIIDRGADGRKLTKSEQVHMCGNSVCPPVAEALVRANCADMIVRQPARRAS